MHDPWNPGVLITGAYALILIPAVYAGFVLYNRKVRPRMKAARRQPTPPWVENVLVGLIIAAVALALVVLVGTLKLIAAGGDWSCVLAADPALCAAVKARP